MPTCKNDSSSYYKGTEPSPKGLGYCAHAEKVNKRRKGKDGKFWIVKTARRSGTTKRIKRWVRVVSAKPKKKKKTSKMKGGMFGIKRKPSLGMRRLAKLYYDEKYNQKTLSETEKKEFNTLAFRFKLFHHAKAGAPTKRNGELMDRLLNDLEDRAYADLQLN